MSNSGNRKSRRRSLSRRDAKKLAALVERNGVQAVAQAVGVHPQTVTALACGVVANHSTVSHVERRLAEIEPGSGSARQTREVRRG